MASFTPDDPGNAAPDDRPIVAELGRPESDEEIIARKSEASRLRRSRQTVTNLVLSLVASLAIVLFLVLVVVRPNQPTREPIDYAQVASEAQDTTSEQLVVPALPPGWAANSARISSGSDGVTTWYIGFVTPDGDFLSLTQGIDANPSWLSELLRRSTSTGSRAVSGVEWTLYSQRDEPDAGNLAFSMVAIAGASTIVLSGTASDPEFATVAESISNDLQESHR